MMAHEFDPLAELPEFLDRRKNPTPTKQTKPPDEAREIRQTAAQMRRSAENWAKFRSIKRRCESAAKRDATASYFNEWGPHAPKPGSNAMSAAQAIWFDNEKSKQMEKHVPKLAAAKRRLGIE